MAQPAMPPGGSPPGLDLVRLGRHLAAVLTDPPQGRLQAEVIAGGRSNVTYRVTDGEGHLGRAPTAAGRGARHRA
jgi:hypothetical protein